MLVMSASWIIDDVSFVFPTAAEIISYHFPPTHCKGSWNLSSQGHSYGVYDHLYFYLGLSLFGHAISNISYLNSLKLKYFFIQVAVFIGCFFLAILEFRIHAVIILVDSEFSSFTASKSVFWMTWVLNPKVFPIQHHSAETFYFIQSDFIWNKKEEKNFPHPLSLSSSLAGWIFLK